MTTPIEFGTPFPAPGVAAEDRAETLLNLFPSVTIAAADTNEYNLDTSRFQSIVIRIQSNSLPNDNLNFFTLRAIWLGVDGTIVDPDTILFRGTMTMFARLPVRSGNLFLRITNPVASQQSYSLLVDASFRTVAKPRIIEWDDVQPYNADNVILSGSFSVSTVTTSVPIRLAPGLAQLYGALAGGAGGALTVSILCNYNGVLQEMFSQGGIGAGGLIAQPAQFILPRVPCFLRLVLAAGTGTARVFMTTLQDAG